MKSKKARNPGGGNAMSAASGSRDRSGGMAGPRVGGSKDSTSMRHSSNRPMSSSPSRMTVDSHYQNRGANYPQHSGNDGNSVGGSSNVAEGVYSNKRLIHACTCLIGTTVQVETIDGNIHEGLFRIFSPELEITLEQAHQIDPKNPTDITAESVKEIMIFEMKEVLHMSAIGVDLDYAAKDGFQTDTQISNKNNGEGGVGTGSGSNFRELKEFEFEDYSMNDDRLDGSFSIEKDRALEDGSNGWSADDMFLLNEKKYGVQTSYKENMEGYTIQLKHDDKSSDEYRDREAKAAKVAREIEGNTSTHLAAELENGDDDEENAFSAVQRDPSQRGDVRDSDGGGKYIPPARRQPSVSSSSGMPMKQHVNSARHQAKGTPPPGTGHTQGHSGGNTSNRGERGGNRGSIGSISGNYGHGQGSSAPTSHTPPTTSSNREHATRDQQPSQDEYSQRGHTAGTSRQEMNKDLRSRGSYGSNAAQASTGPAGQPSLYRQASQNTGERGRLPDPKARDQISDLKNFKENFVLGDPGPVSLPTATSHGEPRLSSDRGSYNQQPYQGQVTTTVSVSANPAGLRDQNNKQSSPKQNTSAGHAAHGSHHPHPYAQHGPEINIAGNRVHSRSPPTPSTSSKGSSPPSLASISTDAPPSLQNSKRFSPSQATGNNTATASTISVASVVSKQADGNSTVRSDARTPPTPTVSVPIVPPDMSNLSIASAVNVSSTSSTSESASTFLSGGSVSSPSSTASSVANVAKKSTLNPNAKEFVLNPTAKAFVPAGALPTATQSVHRPPTALTPQQAHPQRPITPGQSVGGQAHQAVAVQYNSHPTTHFQVHPHTGANFSSVSGAQGSPSVATVQQSHPQMQGQLIQYIHNPAAYAAQQAASSHLAAQAVVQQVQGSQIPGQVPLNAQGSGGPQSYGTPQHYGIPGGTPASVGPPPHNPSAQQQQVPLQVRYQRSGPGNSSQGVSQTPPSMQQSSQSNQQRGQGQSANEVTSPSVLAATGQPLLAPHNSQNPSGLQDSQQPNISALGYQMFNPQMAAHLIQATNPAGGTSVMMRLPNGQVVPITSSMAQMSASSAALQQAAQQAQASVTSGIPPPQQSSDQTQNTGPGSLPPPGGMSLPSPGGNVVTWVPHHHGGQPPSVIPGPPPPTSGIGAPPSHPSNQPPQNQPPPPSSAGPPLPPGQQQSGGQITPAPSPGPGMMYSVQPPGGIAQGQGVPAHHGQSNAQSLHFAANYPSGPGVFVLPPGHASAGMHAIHHQTIMSQAGSMPVQSANGQPITSMAGVMPPPIHHYMQHQPGVQGGVPGQHNPQSILYPVSAHAINAAAVQQQAAAAAAVQQQQNAQPPTPGAQ